MVMRPLTARTATGLLVTATVVAVDQTSKVLASHGEVAGGFVPRNPSYAFGIVGGSAPALIIGAVLVLGAFLVVADVLAVRFGISIVMPALVAGGTIGNTLDRMRLGSVRDFVVTPWAIVNLADFAVAIGVIGLVITLASRVPQLRTRQLATTAR
jgi:lipoprotein signal peptidase